MIAAWMLYCTVLGLLLLAAAHLVERIVNDRREEARRVWVLALLGAAILPVVAMLARDGPPATELSGVVTAVTPTAAFVMDSVASLASLDGLLVRVWTLMSATLAVLLALGMTLTWFRSRQWVSGDVDGVSVLVSQDVGPAVVGFVRGRIVLPVWALEAEPLERSMMLRHEQEHLAAGDPRLILFAALVVVLMPWNVAMWCMARRVRLAVEVDCDRRVMSGGDLDMRSYAELLLSVGARRTTPACGVGFSVGRPFLERRIDRMTLPAGGSRRQPSALAVIGIVLALGMAWALPQPIRAMSVGDASSTCPDQAAAISQMLLESRDWST